MAALSIADVPANVAVRVDTHEHSHLARAKDGLGRPLGQLEVETTRAATPTFLEWARGFGPAVTIGIEGTSSYGAGLTRFLRAQGQVVIEVIRPARLGVSVLCPGHGEPDTGDAARAIRAFAATLWGLLTSPAPAARSPRVRKGGRARFRAPSRLRCPSQHRRSSTWMTWVHATDGQLDSPPGPNARSTLTGSPPPAARTAAHSGRPPPLARRASRAR